MTVRAREAVPNAVLYNLRDAAGLSQQELADRINELAGEERPRPRTASVTANTVSRWERGVVDRPDPLHRRLLAKALAQTLGQEVSIEELGFARPRQPVLDERPVERRGVDMLDLLPAEHMIDARVERSQKDWADVRRALNGARQQLTTAAARLYEPGARLGDTGMLTRQEWLLPHPVDLAGVRLAQDPGPVPAVTGTEQQSRAVRPLASLARRFPRYSHALRDVCQPRLLENRLSYRLVDLDWSAAGDSAQMTFGYTTYFEMLDSCEALAHETAAALLRTGSDGHPVVGHPSWRRLPFRKLIGDPFNLGQRTVLPSIDTLTIRRSAGDSASLVLHRRDSGSVAVAGDMLHVMPCGVFQPSSVLPAAQAADFDLWRNIMREYSEEFLGAPEHDGDGAPIDYAGTEPFATLDAARRDGRVQVYCLGFGLDALTLVGEILTVAVFDADVYDQLFGDMVTSNSEGTVAAAEVPFEEHTVRRLLSGRPHALAAAAAGCLELAWQHRDVILG